MVVFSGAVSALTVCGAMAHKAARPGKTKEASKTLECVGVVMSVIP
jgi:hypothetical protein